MADTQKSDSVLPPCEICSNKTAIYCCPRCSIRTCSLACCRSHKIKSAPDDDENEHAQNDVICNGKRDRTKFCSLKKFSDSQLASDYHFLEDVLKVSDSSKRIYQGLARENPSGPGGTKRVRVDMNADGKVRLDNISDKPPAHPLLKAREGKSIAQVLANGVSELEPEQEEENGKSPSCVSAIRNKLGGQSSVYSPTNDRTSPNQQRGKRDNHVDHLVRQAELYGINLLRMPCGMERRKSNNTKLNKKKVITWKIELCFHASIKKATRNEESNGYSPKLLKIESQMIETSTLSEELGKHLDVHPGNSTIRSQLRAFANVPRGNLVFLLKRLPFSPAAPLYYKLKPDATLLECLKGKTIIEFPTIDVIFDEDKDEYPLFLGEIS